MIAFQQGKSVSRIRRRYVIASLICGGVVVAAAFYLWGPYAVQYETVWLPCTGPAFVAQSLNDRGRIVLSSSTGLHVWDPDTGMRDIGVLAAPYPNHPIPINNAGQLCGGVLDPNGCMQAFFWDPKTGLQRLGTFGEKNSWALDLNSRGQVVGDAGPKAHEGSNPPPKAFLWGAGEPPALLDMRDLGFGGPACVNDRGQVAGFVYSYGQPKGFFAFRWEASGGTSTHLIGNPMTGTVYIDGHGSVIWARRKGKDGPSRVVIWGNDGHEQQIEFPVDAAEIIGVNDVGQILAHTFQFRPAVPRVSRLRAAIYRYLPLPKGEDYWLCDPSGRKTQIKTHAHGLGDYFAAVALNNRGWILARDGDPQGTYRWLILKPIHEN
jgi:uncharacterized membrane protein